MPPRFQHFSISPSNVSAGEKSTADSLPLKGVTHVPTNELLAIHARTKRLGPAQFVKVG